MASKIIILSGAGRGIARLYEMSDKIRVEADCVVNTGEKRLGIIVNGKPYSADFQGRQTAIDLEKTKILSAAVVVYSEGQCIISGSSGGKCDTASAMYTILNYDSEREAQQVYADLNEDAETENAVQELTPEIENKKSGEEVGETEYAENPIAVFKKPENEAGKFDIEPIDESEVNTEFVAADSADEIDNEAIVGDAVEIDGTPIEIADLPVSADKKVEPQAIADDGELVRKMLDDKTELSVGADSRDNEPFYAKVWHKIEEMFDIYPRDKVLEDLVYDSEWIRIPYEDDGFYVLGVIKDEGTPIFICYGIPSDKMERPDKEIEDSCEWLPIDKRDKSGRGYWLVYQDALTGENIS